MNCKRFNNLVFAYLDEDLKGVLSREFESHLKKCSSCKKQLEITKKTWMALDKYEEIEPSSDFNVKVFGRIHKKEQASIESARNFGFFPRFIPRLSPVLTAIIIFVSIAVVLKISPFIGKTKYLTEEEIFIVKNKEMLNNLDILKEDVEFLKELDLVESLVEIYDT